jgi:hypothetical protein
MEVHGDKRNRDLGVWWNIHIQQRLLRPILTEPQAGAPRSEFTFVDLPW